MNCSSGNCTKYLEIYRNNKDGVEKGESPFAFHSKISLSSAQYSPKEWEKAESLEGGRASLIGGQLTFTDVDGDGNVDIIYPRCVSSGKSIFESPHQRDCNFFNNLQILYNVQQTLCPSIFETLGFESREPCRTQDNLCTEDRDFTFGEVDRNGSPDTIIIRKEAFKGFYFFAPLGSGTPLTIRTGDFNLDGYPDLLIPMVKNKTSISSLSRKDAAPFETTVFGSGGGGSLLFKSGGGDLFSSLWEDGKDFLEELEPGDIVLSLWKNVPCSPDYCHSSATAKRRRTFVPVVGDEVAALLQVKNPFAGAFFDLDETGNPDILVLTNDAALHNSSKRTRTTPLRGGGGFAERRSAATTRTTTTTTQEENIRLTGNGGETVALYNSLFNDAFFLKTLGAGGQSSDPKPYGVNFPGGFFKFIVTDLSGEKRIAVGGQLSQSSYLSLQTPFLLFGLGRAGNYIELLYYGLSLHASLHWNSWICIIPNSQLVVLPYPLDKSLDWQMDLYLAPSGITVAVIISMVSSLVALAGVVYFFDWREKMEDEKEKREKAHLFSFDAL